MVVVCVVCGFFCTCHVHLALFVHLHAHGFVSDHYLILRRADLAPEIFPIGGSVAHAIFWEIYWPSLFHCNGL